MLYNDIKFQLQLTFELELLKNKKLEIINYELENSDDYVGKEIVHGSHPYQGQIDTSDLEEIADEAVEDFLKHEMGKTIYKITVDDGCGNSYCIYPVVYCTDLCIVCDAIKFICEILYDVACDNSEFDVREYLSKDMTIEAFQYKNDKLISTIIL